MTNLYDKTSERLWEKLEWHRKKIDTSYIDLSEPYSISQILRENPLVDELINEVQEEFNYKLDEFQYRWAVNQFIKGGADMMKQYNEKNGKELVPRM